MRNKAVQRIIFIVVLFGSVFLAPWWAVLPIGLAGLLRFNAPEVVIAGFFIDLLYAVPLPSWFDFQFFFTSLFALLYLVVFYGKRRLIAYS